MNGLVWSGSSSISASISSCSLESSPENSGWLMKTSWAPISFSGPPASNAGSKLVQPPMLQAVGPGLHDLVIPVAILLPANLAP